MLKTKISKISYDNRDLNYDKKPGPLLIRAFFESKHDLKGIFNYITHNSCESCAAKFLKELETTMQKLANSPGMGNHRDHLEPGLLGFAEGNYMMFYQQI